MQPILPLLLLLLLLPLQQLRQCMHWCLGCSWCLCCYASGAGKLHCTASRRVQVARKEAPGLVLLGKQAIDDDSNQVGGMRLQRVRGRHQQGMLLHAAMRWLCTAMPLVLLRALLRTLPLP